MLTLSLAFTALAATALAQDISTSTTQAGVSSSTGTSQPPATTAAPDISNAVTGILFLNGSQAITGFDARLLCADSSQSTYVLACPGTEANEFCRTARNVPITVTAGPTSYDIRWTAAQGGARGLVTQSCSFDGPSVSATQAVCSLSGYIAVGGRSAQITSTIETIDRSTFPATATYSITSGASNANAASCPATPTPTVQTPVNPGTSGMVANAAAPTGAAREVFKVLIPVGAAAVAFAGM